MWTTFKDPNSGKEYYVNLETKELSWEKPAELKANAPGAKAESENDKGGKTNAVSAEPSPSPSPTSSTSTASAPKPSWSRTSSEKANINSTASEKSDGKRGSLKREASDRSVTKSTSSESVVSTTSNASSGIKDRLAMFQRQSSKEGDDLKKGPAPVKRQPSNKLKEKMAALFEEKKDESSADGTDKPKAAARPKPAKSLAMKERAARLAGALGMEPAPKKEPIQTRTASKSVAFQQRAAALAGALGMQNKGDAPASETISEEGGSPEKKEQSDAFKNRKAQLAALFGGGAAKATPTASTSDNTWDAPAGRGASKTVAVRPAAAAPSNEPKWLEAVDPSSGDTYYYHVDTLETSWDRPPELDDPPPAPVAPPAPAAPAAAATPSSAAPTAPPVSASAAPISLSSTPSSSPTSGPSAPAVSPSSRSSGANGVPSAPFVAPGTSPLSPTVHSTPAPTPAPTPATYAQSPPPPAVAGSMPDLMSLASLSSLGQNCLEDDDDLDDAPPPPPGMASSTPTPSSLKDQPKVKHIPMMPTRLSVSYQCASSTSPQRHSGVGPPPPPPEDGLSSPGPPPPTTPTSRPGHSRPSSAHSSGSRSSRSQSEAPFSHRTTGSMVMGALSSGPLMKSGSIGSAIFEAGLRVIESDVFMDAHLSREESKSIANPVGDEGVVLVPPTVGENDVEFNADELTFRRDRYKLEKYGADQLNLHKKGLFGKYTNEEMLLHTPKLLPAPLHRRLEGTEAEDAVQAFRNVTGYTFDRKTSKAPIGHVFKLCNLAILGSDILRDEFYLQVLKQTRNCPTHEGRIRAWQLMAVFTGVFAPSNEFLPYVETALDNVMERIGAEYGFGDGNAEVNALVAKFAEYCTIRLKSTIANGMRWKPPTQLELDAVEERRPIALRVSFLDDTYKTLATESQTTVKDVEDTMYDKLGIARDDTCGLFQLTYNMGARISCKALHPKVRLADLIASWYEKREEFNKENSRNDVKFKLVFKVKHFIGTRMRTMDPVMRHMFFIQGVSDVLHGFFPCSDSQAFKLAGLFSQAQFGDSDPRAILESGVLHRVLPPGTLERNLSFDSIEYVLREKQLVANMTQEEAKIAYIKFLNDTFPTYGCSFFEAAQLEPKVKPKDLFVAISERGIFLVDVLSHEVRSAAPLTEVLSYGFMDQKVFMELGASPTTSIKYTFQVYSAPEVAALLKTYRKE